MHDESRKDIVWWVLAGVMVLIIVAAGVIGVIKVTNWKRATVWEVTVGEMTLEPMKVENGEEEADYYKLRFELTNNSNRDIEAAGYRFEIAAQNTGSRTGILIVDQGWDESVTLHQDSCVPSGCTGLLELYLEVYPDRLDSHTLDVKLDPYNEGSMLLGSIQIPE